MEIAPGTRLGDSGRYCLRRLLGTGGMASVWLADDEGDGEQVAVKVMSDSLALDPGAVARFEQEAWLATSLTHPHLVRGKASGSERGRPYLVTEYLSGGSLKDRLTPTGADGDGIHLARQLLYGLRHLHDSSVLHRDLKPANVLFDSAGNARLIDFGICRLTYAPGITSVDVVMGTREYIAPEVLRGRPFDVRSDLYSCGRVLARARPSDACGTFDRLVATLTAEHPASRPQNAGQALNLLSPPLAAQS